MPLIWESLVEVQGITVARPLREHSLQQQVLDSCDSHWAGLGPNHYEEKEKRGVVGLVQIQSIFPNSSPFPGFGADSHGWALLCCLPAGVCGFTAGCLWLWGVGAVGCRGLRAAPTHPTAPGFSARLLQHHGGVFCEAPIKGRKL